MVLHNNNNNNNSTNNNSSYYTDHRKKYRAAYPIHNSRRGHNNNQYHRGSSVILQQYGTTPSTSTLMCTFYIALIVTVAIRSLSVVQHYNNDNVGYGTGSSRNRQLSSSLSVPAVGQSLIRAKTIPRNLINPTTTSSPTSAPFLAIGARFPTPSPTLEPKVDVSPTRATTAERSSSSGPPTPEPITLEWDETIPHFSSSEQQETQSGESIQSDDDNEESMKRGEKVFASDPELGKTFKASIPLSVPETVARSEEIRTQSTLVSPTESNSTRPQSSEQSESPLKSSNETMAQPNISLHQNKETQGSSTIQADQPTVSASSKLMLSSLPSSSLNTTALTEDMSLLRNSTTGNVSVLNSLNTTDTDATANANVITPSDTKSLSLSTNTLETQSSLPESASEATSKATLPIVQFTDCHKLAPCHVVDDDSNLTCVEFYAKRFWDSAPSHLIRDLHWHRQHRLPNCWYETELLMTHRVVSNWTSTPYTNAVCTGPPPETLVYWHNFKVAGTTARQALGYFGFPNYNTSKQIFSNELRTLFPEETHLGRRPAAYLNYVDTVKEQIYEQQRTDHQNNMGFTFVRSPVQRFLSGLEEIERLDDLDWEVSPEARPCFTTADATAKIECIVNKIQETGVFFNVHIYPQAYLFDAWTKRGELDISVNVLDLKDMDPLFKRFKGRIVLRARESVKAGRKLNVVDTDLKPTLLLKICKLYEADLQMLEVMGMKDQLCAQAVAVSK